MIVNAFTKKLPFPPNLLHQMNPVHILLPIHQSMPRFPVYSNTFSLWLNICTYLSICTSLLHEHSTHHRTCCNPSKNFTIYEALHHEIYSFFFLLRKKYPAWHPVYGEVSYCYWTPDNIRNECIISVGLKKEVFGGGVWDTAFTTRKRKLNGDEVYKTVPAPHPLNVGCRQFGTLESEKGEVTGCGLSWVSSRWNRMRSHMICCLAVGLYVEGCITVKLLLRLNEYMGLNFDVYIGRAAW